MQRWRRHRVRTQIAAPGSVARDLGVAGILGAPTDEDGWPADFTGDTLGPPSVTVTFRSGGGVTVNLTGHRWPSVQGWLDRMDCVPVPVRLSFEPNTPVGDNLGYAEFWHQELSGSMHGGLDVTWWPRGNDLYKAFPRDRLDELRGELERAMPHRLEEFDAMLARLDAQYGTSS